MGDGAAAGDENQGKSPRKRRELTAVDLFAGAGGMSWGLTEAGFRVIAAVEKDVQAFQTYRLNHLGSGQLLSRDAREVTAADLMPSRRQRLDLAAGGPPCQGFSIKGQRRADHPGNGLLMEFVRLVAELQPRAALMENVPGLLSLAGGYYFDRLVTGLERIRLPDGGRYDVEFAILNAAEHGVPQVRRRLFVVAVEPGRRFEWPTAVSEPGDWTLWDAIADLPAQLQAEGGPPPYAGPAGNSYARSLRRGTTVLNHHTKRLEELRMRRLAALKPGQDRRHLPPELQAGGHETKYRRLRPAQPCPTVTAHMGKDLSDFIHPRLDRTLTVREAARVQGFPDDYEFVGSLASQFTQVGNAVPVPLARALGLELATTLSRRRGRRPASDPLRQLA